MLLADRGTEVALDLQSPELAVLCARIKRRTLNTEDTLKFYEESLRILTGLTVRAPGFETCQ
jgi:hypothetical protein